MNNIYTLDNKVSVKQAFPYGLQHAIVLIISNITAMLMIVKNINDESVNTIQLIQNSLFIVGIATIIQVLGIQMIGGKIPLVIGTSFAYTSVIILIIQNYGFGTAIGSCLVGGAIIFLLGFFTKFYKKIISDLVSGIVVLAIGLTLLKVSANSFIASGTSNEKSMIGFIIAFTSLIVYIIFNIFTKGIIKELSVLFSLLSGFILGILLGRVDFSIFDNSTIITYPKLIDFNIIKFDITSIISILIIYIASITDIVGNTYIINKNIINDESGKELSGTIKLIGLMSFLASLFGIFPVTSYGENIAIINNNKVINKKCFVICGIITIICSFFPFISNIFLLIPVEAIGGAMIVLFGTIITSGIKIISECGFDKRNTIIISTSIAVGFGLPLVSAFDNMPMILKTIGNSYIICMFITALLLDLILPKKKILQ